MPSAALTTAAASSRGWPSSISPVISSRDFPLVSGNRRVNIMPTRLQPTRTNSKVLNWFLNKWKANTPTTAPIFPTAPDIPWHVERNLAGKSSAGKIKVVVFGLLAPPPRRSALLLPLASHKEKLHTHTHTHAPRKNTQALPRGSLDDHTGATLFFQPSQPFH